MGCVLPTARLSLTHSTYLENSVSKKSLKPSREKELLGMASKLGLLTLVLVKSQKRYITMHNDKLCGVRTPTDADKRDVAAAKRRHLILSQKRMDLELDMQKLAGVPGLLDDPRKSLG